MTIPMFAIDPTKSPYKEVEDFTGGQRTAQNDLTSAQKSEGEAFVSMGANMGELGQKVFDYAMKTREQNDLNYVQRIRFEANKVLPKVMKDWQLSVTGENALEAPKDLTARMAPHLEQWAAGAPNERTKKFILENIGGQIEKYQTEGEKHALETSKAYSASLADQSDQELIKSAYQAKGEASQLQRILDEGKAFWAGQGRAATWINWDGAKERMRLLENKATMAFLDGQLANPETFAMGALDFSSGKYDEFLSLEQLKSYEAKFNAMRRQRIEDVPRIQKKLRDEFFTEQNNTTLEFVRLYVNDPERFASEATAPVITELVESGRINSRQGGTLMNMRAGQDRSSDPFMLDEAYELAVAGKLDPEWLADHGSRLSGPDLLIIHELMKKGPIANEAVSRVAPMAMFAFSADRAAFGERNYCPGATFAAASAFAAKRLSEGAIEPRVRAEVQLAFDPRLGDSATVPINNYVDTIPEDPETLTPIFKRLWYADAKTLSQDEFNRQWRHLFEIKERSEKRRALKQYLKTFDA